MNTKLNDLERRIVELSYAHKLSHISSCLNVINLIDWVYEQRKEDEPFVLGSGHASLAHYVVLEKHELCDAEEMIEKHGVHSSRDMEHGIWCSNGSLGMAESISCGFALANSDRLVWLVTSDGACMEGSVAESFRFAEKYCPNLKIFIVWNGLGAYGSIELKDLPKLPKRTEIVKVDQARYPEFLRGLQGHYATLNESQYKEIMP